VSPGSTDVEFARGPFLGGERAGKTQELQDFRTPFAFLQTPLRQTLNMTRSIHCLGPDRGILPFHESMVGFNFR